MCPQCRAFITTDDRICPYCDSEVAPRAVDIRSPADIAGLIPSNRFLTSLLLLINLGLYAATLAASGSLDPSGQVLLAFGAKWRPAIYMGQYWRLITAGFLHGGTLHILMNSWVLFDLGPQVEEFYGQSRMLVIYIAATIGGFYFSYLWSPALSVGASAGIFGLLGAMIALGVRSRSAFASEMRSFYIRWAVYGFAMGLLPGMAIDNAAHLGGLAAGFGVAYVAGTPRLSGKGESLWKLLAGIAVALTVISFVPVVLRLVFAQR